MQLIFLASMLYVSLIAMVNGSIGVDVMSLFIVFLLAGAYSFFNPVKISGIDALQSNGAMLALMGIGTYNIVENAPGMSFFLMYCLLAVDCVASFSTYFQTHS